MSTKRFSSSLPQAREARHLSSLAAALTTRAAQPCSSLPVVQWRSGQGQGQGQDSSLLYHLCPQGPHTKQEPVHHQDDGGRSELHGFLLHLHYTPQSLLHTCIDASINCSPPPLTSHSLLHHILLVLLFLSLLGFFNFPFISTSFTPSTHLTISPP